MSFGDGRKRQIKLGVSDRVSVPKGRNPVRNSSEQKDETFRYRKAETFRLSARTLPILLHHVCWSSRSSMDFKPGVVTPAEFLDRKGQCTSRQLSLLVSSAEFRKHHFKKRRHTQGTTSVLLLWCQRRCLLWGPFCSQRVFGLATLFP